MGGVTRGLINHKVTRRIIWGSMWSQEAKGGGISQAYPQTLKKLSGPCAGVFHSIPSSEIQETEYFWPGGSHTARAYYAKHSAKLINNGPK